MAKDTEISEGIERIITRIEQLESGAHSKSTGEELFEEGQKMLADLRDFIDDENGEVIELD